MTGLKTFLALQRLCDQTKAIKNRGGTVPCWDSVNYDCADCPALDACKTYADTTGEEGVRCHG